MKEEKFKLINVVKTKDGSKIVLSTDEKLQHALDNPNEYELVCDYPHQYDYFSYCC